MESGCENSLDTKHLPSPAPWPKSSIHRTRTEPSRLIPFPPQQQTIQKHFAFSSIKFTRPRRRFANKTIAFRAQVKKILKGGSHSPSSHRPSPSTRTCYWFARSRIDRWNMPNCVASKASHESAACCCPITWSQGAASHGPRAPPELSIQHGAFHCRAANKARMRRLFRQLFPIDSRRTGAMHRHRHAARRS
jgi:hypothetical protein